MGMTAKEIEDAVRSALPDANISLTDLAGDNDHYAITVESAQFSGKTRVAQHKMVMDALGGGMGTRLHALSITTKTPVTQ
jgi:stress-induced morphogen